MVDEKVREAAKEIVDGVNRARGFHIDWIVKRAEIVARALLSLDAGGEDNATALVIRQAATVGLRTGIETAARWHDKRYRDTPDAFEMELHQASAKALRALPGLPSSADAPHPCANRCQYAIDIGMPEHSCGNGCMYEKHKTQASDSLARHSDAQLREALEACRDMMLYGGHYLPPEKRGPTPGHHVFDEPLRLVRSALSNSIPPAPRPQEKMK